MNVPREQLLFVVTALVVVATTWLDLSDRYDSPRVPRAEPLDAPLPAPAARVRYGSPLDDTAAPERAVGTFSPPRELLPLEPLELPEPPLPSIAVRRPRLDPSRVGAAARAERMAADEFGDATRAADDEVPLDVVVDVFDADAPETDTSPGDDADADAPVDDVAYEERFDWVARISTGRRVYGRLLNDDPHGLARRPDETLVFQQVSTRSGRPLGAPYEIERDDVVEFALARTFENEAIERSRDLGTGPGSAGSRRALALDLLEAHPAEPQALAFAAREAERALAVDPDGAAGYRLLASIRRLEHDIEGELEVYAGARERGIRSAVLAAEHGELLAGLGLVERAAEQLTAAEAIDRTAAEVAWLRGRLAELDGRHADALAAYRAAESSAFAEPLERQRRRDAIRAVGRTSLALGRLDDAEREARRLLVDDPASHDALLLLASVEAARGDLERAAEHVDAALAARPESSRALTNAAILAWRRDDAAGAERLLQRAIDVDPLSAARAHRALGVVHEDLGEREPAREEYIAALRLVPDDVSALYRLGRLQRTEGDVEAATTTLRTALARGGPEALLMGELGLAALGRGAPDDARGYFREALRLEPDDAVFEWLLGLSILRQGDVLAAVEPLERASVSAPGAHAALGVARYRQGEVAAALDHFDEAASSADGAHADFAAEQAERIRVNESKRQWLDRFRRTSLQRGWTQHQWDGSPRVWFVPGEVHVEGRVEAVRADERPGLSRIVEGRTFDAATVEMSARRGRFGVALTYRQVKGALGRLPKARLSLTVDDAGAVRGRVLDQFDTVVLDDVELARVDPDVVADGLALGIRRDDPVGGVFSFLLGGRPIGEPVQVKSLRNFKNPFELEVFADAPPGRAVDATLTLCRIVQTP